MVFSLWLWQTTKLTMTKNTCEMLAISIAMRIWRCDAGHIARWSASVASYKSTRCRHWASACAVSSRWPPWLKILKKKHNKTQLLPSFFTVDQQKKLTDFETRQGPSTHILGARFSDPNLYATIPVEGTSYILRYQM
jgi:hypothetical protein